MSSSGRVADARRAVIDFVAELQRGIDEHDADIYNNSFANDVIWGGPFGATIVGYDDLHQIHIRLQAAGAGEHSRYEIVHVTAPLPEFAIAHVRRRPMDGDNDGFAEMARYVLVKSANRWWLVAGQNTPIQPGRSATD